MQPERRAVDPGVVGRSCLSPDPEDRRGEPHASPQVNDFARAADVVMVAGRPVLTITAENAGVVASLLEAALGARYRLGRSPLPAVHEILAAARAAHAVSVLAVPDAEPLLANAFSPSAVWITTKQAAEMLGVGERAVTKRIAVGALAARKVSGRWLVRLKPEAA